MGKATVLSILAALLLVGATSTARADDYGPDNMTFEAGGSLGLFVPSADHEFYEPGRPHHELSMTGLDLGLRLGFYPSIFVGIEGEANIIPIGGSGGVDPILIALRMHAIGQFPIGRIVPFGVLGFGTMISKGDALGDDTDAASYLGVGVKYYVTPRLNVRLDARLIRAPKYEPAVDGVGTNHGEILLGAAWKFGGSSSAKAEPEPEPEPDADGDEIPDKHDRCPQEAGPKPEGCPIGDKDNDGLLDNVDTCPDEPETINAYKDDDGCPDTLPDTDGDGITDDKDKCPEQAEDADAFQDEDGCPDEDNDGDGVVDSADRCPNQAGVVENRGCPDTDRDSDGVVDRIDNCPDEPGTAENAGCKKKQLVTITQTNIKILDKVFFRTGRAVIQRKSHKLLDNVARVLIAHGEIKKVSVEGHTDDKGKDDKNKTLSQKRAEAVVAYLVKKGVPAERLEAIGFGEEKPIADNKTRKGRADNRRVEFNIVD